MDGVEKIALNKEDGGTTLVDDRAGSQRTKRTAVVLLFFVVVCFFLLHFALLVLALAKNEKDPFFIAINAAISIVLLVIVLCLRVVVNRGDEALSFGTLCPSREGLAVLVCSFSIYLNLVIRLLAPPSYLPLPSSKSSSSASGYTYEGPTNYDFGPKNVRAGDADNDDDDAELSGNVAFTVAWNSLGHFSWGASAVIFFLPVSVRHKFEQKERSFYVLQVACNMLACILVTFYPTYNLAKRMIKNMETFPSSSFCNNGLEWATGCVLISTVFFAIEIYSKMKMACRGDRPSNSTITQEFIIFGDNVDRIIKFYVPAFMSVAMYIVSVMVPALFTAYWAAYSLSDVLTILGFWSVFLVANLVLLKIYSYSGAC